MRVAECGAGCTRRAAFGWPSGRTMTRRESAATVSARSQSLGSPLIQLRLPKRPGKRFRFAPIHYRDVRTAAVEVVDRPGGLTKLLEALEETNDDAADFVRALQFDFRTEPYDAIERYKAWTDRPELERAMSVEVDFTADLPVLTLVLAPPRSVTTSRGALLARFAEQRIMPMPHTVGLHFMAARHYFLSGERTSARGILERAMEIERHFLLETASFVVRTADAQSELPAYLRDVFGDGDYFRGRICPRPFEEFQIDHNGDVYICCPSYLNLPVGNVRRESYHEILNSEMARNIRQSILNGTFKYCNRSTCPSIRHDGLEREQAIEDEELRDLVTTRSDRVHRVKHVALSMDSTCNLWCPSCRQEKIVEKSATVEWKVRSIDEVVLPLLRDADSVMMNGYGDVFMSQICQRVLSRINSREYPRLKIHLLTNGVLFDRRNWQRYPNIHDMVSTVRVSVDAATERTYRSVRRGGDFHKLHDNLRFLAVLRREGSIERFGLAFVYQEENFTEMAEFAKQGLELGCDRVAFEALLDWNTYARAEYEQRAVHLPGHPRHAEFRELTALPVFRHPHVHVRGSI
ncbi:MAG: hypothetical protein B7733_11350 [Myxococcales bacterium FL481]|nr:MAG: hypothetical protein B7733_11350 [Myxococcales bacterium FL481]